MRCIDFSWINFSLHQGSNEVGNASSEIIFGKLYPGWFIRCCSHPPRDPRDAHESKRVHGAAAFASLQRARHGPWLQRDGSPAFAKLRRGEQSRGYRAGVLACKKRKRRQPVLSNEIGDGGGGFSRIARVRHDALEPDSFRRRLKRR